MCANRLVTDVELLVLDSNTRKHLTVCNQLINGKQNYSH